MIYVLDRVENIVGKGENAFPLFPQGFLQLSFWGSLVIEITDRKQSSIYWNHWKKRRKPWNFPLRTAPVYASDIFTYDIFTYGIFTTLALTFLPMAILPLTFLPMAILPLAFLPHTVCHILYITLPFDDILDLSKFRAKAGNRIQLGYWDLWRQFVLIALGE